MTTQPASAPSAAPAAAPAASAPAPASSQPSSAPAASPSPVPSGADREAARVQEVIDYDPFGPPAEPSTPAAAPATPDPAAPSAAPASGQPEPAASSPAAPATPAAVNLSPEDRALLTNLANAAAQPASTPRADQPSPDETPPYAFNVPDPIMALMASEVPAERKRGVEVLLQGALRATHQTIVTQMRGEFMKVMQTFVAQQFEQQKVAQTVQSDYFGKYKEHDIPQLRPIIRQLAGQLAVERNASSWTPQLRDELATRVNAFLAQFRTAAPAAPAPAAPALTPPSSRPAPSNLPPDQAAMLDLLH